MDANGVLASIFDSATNSLRISAVGDAYSIPAGELHTTATVITTNDVPRIEFPDAATTTAWGYLQKPVGWTTVDMGLLWAGSTAGTNPVRWRMALKNLAMAIDNVNEAFVSDVSANINSPSTIGVTSLTANHLNDVSVVGGTFGSSYPFLIQRVGADAGDTYTGVAELLGVLVFRA